MKDKVINTRVSKELYEKISAKAKKHRTTTANLIRNLVEDSIEIYEDLADIIDNKIKDKFCKEKELLGFQSFVLLNDQKCSQCQKKLIKGTECFLAIHEKDQQKEIYCQQCKENSSQKK